MRRLLLNIALYGGLIVGVIAAAAAGLSFWVIALVGTAVVVPLSLWIDRAAPPVRRPPASLIVLLVGNLLFCALGVLLLFLGEKRLGLMTLALFGGGAALALDGHLRQLRERRLRELPIESVAIAGGVDIRISISRFAVMGVWLTAIGVTMSILGQGFPWLLRILGTVIAGAGVCVLAMLPFMWRRRLLRFEPDGIVIGKLRYQCRVPWDSIHAVGIMEQASNPFVTLHVTDPLLITVQPPSRRESFLKQVISTRAWQGADLVIATLHFGLQAPLLAEAIRHYVGDPGARRDLGVRLLKQQR